MKNSNLVVLSVFAVVFTSCQIKIGGEIEPVVEAPSIEGLWSTECIEDSADSYIKSIQVENGNMTIATMTYAGTRDCDQANLSTTAMKYGPLTIMDDNSFITDGKNYEWQVDENTIHHGVFAIVGAATPDYMHLEAECTLPGYDGICPSVSDRPTTLGGSTYFRR